MRLQPRHFDVSSGTEGEMPAAKIAAQPTRQRRAAHAQEPLLEP